MTPKNLLRASLAITLAFALVHLAGLRACLSVVSLTLPPHLAMPLAVAGAALYAVAWLAFVFAAPVLGLAAAIGLAVGYAPCRAPSMTESSSPRKAPSSSSG